jgi:hypothetical protein
MTGSKETTVQKIGVIIIPEDFTEPLTLLNPVPPTTATWQQC